MEKLFFTEKAVIGLSRRIDGKEGIGGVNTLIGEGLGIISGQKIELSISCSLLWKPRLK